MFRRFAVFVLVAAAIALGLLVWGIVEVGEAATDQPPADQEVVAEPAGN